MSDIVILKEMIMGTATVLLEDSLMATRKSRSHSRNQVLPIIS